MSAGIEGLGTKGFTIIGDVLDDAQIPRIVAEAEEKLGGLDRMITIVGAAALKSLMDTTAEIWDQQMQSQSALLLSGSERSRHRDDPSRHRWRGSSASPPSTASAPPDAGRLWRGEGRPDQHRSHHGGRVGAAHISVNAIAPGHIVTPRLFDTPQRAERYTDSLLPARQRGTTDDIGKAALFLLPTRVATSTGPRWMSMADCWPPICSRQDFPAEPEVMLHTPPLCWQAAPDTNRRVGSVRAGGT